MMMMMIQKQGRGADSRRGSAIVTAVVGVLLLAGMTSAILSFGMASKKEIEGTREEARALYLAEAGVSEALAALHASLQPNVEVPTEVGTYENPMSLHGGSYWVDVVDNMDGTFTATSFGSANGATRAIEVVITESGGGVFANALFAGNSSEDPTYALELSGNGDQADSVTGDIFSGGDVDIQGDATIAGDISASGTIIGASGEEGASQPLLDIDSMNYAFNHDVDVAGEFDAASWYSDDGFGGHAYQVEESNPAHIFRKNPSDRSGDTNATEADDYFLEDPYESVQLDPNSDGSDASAITLSGQGGNPGINGSELVYYIDGNLWVHNFRTYSFRLAHAAGESARVTFVVNGNVYFSDNIFLQDMEEDGIAFIAMENEDIDDSGNIYFGDPEFGTLEYMASFMYAENDFHDYNLDAAGSATVTVIGNMTAGNHVDIERDWGSQHSKLTVLWDERIEADDFAFPGLPATTGAGSSGFTVLAWREVPLP